MQNSTTNHRHVVAMPYPGRGHINPMLNLCKLILLKSNNLSITFVVTEEWLSFLGSEMQHKPANFDFTALPQVIPSEIGRGADFPGFMEAVSTKLQDPFERLLDRLEPSPIAIIHDFVLDWVVCVGNERSVPVASLVTFSASSFTVFSHFDLLVQNGHFPLNVSERGHEVVDYIPGLPSTTIADLPTIFQGDGRMILHRALEDALSVQKSQHLLFTSIYEFEDQVIDCLREKLDPQIYHIGPMIPYFNLTSESINNFIPDNSTNSNPSYIQWLNSQPESSVLYISQGSFLSASSTQMDEFIAGVKESQVRFLWVTRGDNTRFKDDVTITTTQDGPTEVTCKTDDKRGFLVPWCDQLRVLCHPSVGGFWTHCGWNSTSEGIYAGVPMLTCPIFWDQMPNSKMIVKDMKIGWKVMNNDKGELVTRQEIAQLVKSFMDPENDERKVMVRRAKELRDIFRRAVMSGGSAASDLDAFINNI